ncbi:MAG: hypothetical protein CSA20_02170 [Deltaproteobacteria bacterium]|nr:MAG: hypothetical protein CSA20_02170 [Deltaproteobacteria bacterium]
MYSSLLDAPVNTELTLLRIDEPRFAEWLKRLGLFPGNSIIRHDSEVQYNPVRVRGTKGDVIIPAGLGIKVFVHVDGSDERKPLVEMQRKERGHVETMSCGMGCVRSLAKMGLSENEKVTFIRSLPHMDYITLISKKEHTRLSEGEAARIWGECQGQGEVQFYFAKQGAPFNVHEIIGGKKAQEHLQTHGVQPGSTIVLEAIEQASELHQPGFDPLIISSPGGLRLYLNPVQAGKIVVKAKEAEG